MVMQFQYNAHEYATALLALERISSSNKALLMGITGRRNMLLTRIESITGMIECKLLQDEIDDAENQL